MDQVSECLEHVVERARVCRVCASELPHLPRPVLSLSVESRIVIIGQAPGSRVHQSGVPWQDASGRKLREWLGVEDTAFYDTKKFALLPMGLCYPGKGKSGDLAPRAECAPLWHELLLGRMPQRKLVILIGAYAQNYYLGRSALLTERVQAFEDYLPEYFPIPHPSPRNRAWLMRHSWFESEVLPRLKQEVMKALA